MQTASPRATNGRYRRLRLEPLESRTMLAITVDVGPSGVLSIEGDAGDIVAGDAIRVTSSGGVVAVNGTPVVYGPALETLFAFQVTRIVISSWGGADFIDLTGVDAAFSQLSSTQHSITVFCGSGIDRFNGSQFPEEVNGGEGGDQLTGNAGDDLIRGQEQTDRIAGGDGDDTLFGGSDDDTMNGEAGNDGMNGESGDDDMRGGLAAR